MGEIIAKKFCVNEDVIREYLESLRKRGVLEETAKSYGKVLQDFCAYLRESGDIDRETLRKWRDGMVKDGFAARTVNRRIYIVNGFLDYLGFREYQLTGSLKREEARFPEITRAEYQILLQTAKAMGRERLYLMIKTFALTGIESAALPSITAANAERGTYTVEYHRSAHRIVLPKCLQRELLDYARRETLGDGSIFVTRNGKPITRMQIDRDLKNLCRAAGISESKGNTYCLRALYDRTRREMESSARSIVEEMYSRMIEREQQISGWGV